MDFKEYQKETHKTFLDNDDQMGLKLSRMALGIAEEGGECAGKVKKFLRRDFGLSDLKEMLSKEMGDTLWYISEMCNLLGISMEDIAKQNIEKLKDRHDRDQIKGSGDDR